MFFLLARQFIWRPKFTTKNLDKVHYINFMIYELTNLFNTQVYRGKVRQFMHNWQAIFDHFGVELGSSDKFVP